MGDTVERLHKRAPIGPTTPLRLSLAAEIAFPNGGVTGASLRREAARGRLVIERIAGKDYTTLQAIEDMRQLCRLQPKAPVCGSDQSDSTPAEGSPTTPHGSSGTVPNSIARDALLARLQKRKQPSPNS